MKPVISAHHISKKYRLGMIGRTSIRESWQRIAQEVKSNGFKGFCREWLYPDEKKDTIWALKDISFSVQPGEILGIVGRNGSGKTTLLRILSKITKPTEGFAVIHGRASSLLGVGTGFNTELSGRENIFLNGTILGMRHKEVQKRFDEIVEFSEVEKFIDTPVKHYSSGMMVRLAFSVAVHLDQPILFIDEVLAVGDAAFQSKSIAKMKSIVQSGKTILFVSHGETAITSLCHRCLYLKQGHLIASGTPSEILSMYRTDLNLSVAA
ncbi:MAG: ABC transporter ATP-binding protein [Deltaproteobacteria bacterium]